jgi:hypothetical protein
MRRGPARAPRAPHASGAARVPALVALTLAVALAACERDAPPPPVDSVVTPAAPPPPPAEPPVPPATTTWNGAIGEALVVPGDAGEALVIVPGTSDGGVRDTAPGAAAELLPAAVALFSRAGASGAARARPLARPGDGCARWPAARIETADGGLVPPWTVGLVGRGDVAPVPLDSIEGLASGDSAQLAATVTRLAAALPGDTAHDFRGLPYTVRSARRFAIADAQAIVATLARNVNHEAEPLAEQVLLVAERPPNAAAGAAWRVAYHERRSAREEALPWVEPLAAVRVRDGAGATLVLAREYEGGSAYSLLERTGPRTWRVRWTSAYVGCARR